MFISSGFTSACPVNVLKRYVLFGSKDITPDYFLFKSAFKSEKGLKRIYKDEKLNYIPARKCILFCLNP